jgi:uncharacterized protein (UPF0548 family)
MASEVRGVGLGAVPVILIGGEEYIKIRMDIFCSIVLDIPMHGIQFL